MKAAARWLVMALVLCAGIAHAQDATPEVTPEATADRRIGEAGLYTVQMRHDGQVRSLSLYVPESALAAAEPRPLVIGLHGAYGTGANFAPYSTLVGLADREGILVVFPDGLNTIWDDGRPNGPNPPVDDVGFIARMLGNIAQVTNMDAAQVYALGYSMGGSMAVRLACELPGQIAGIAVVAASMPEYLRGACDDAPPLPVMFIQGTDDRVLPFLGVRGTYLSFEATRDYWGEHNGCLVAGPQEALEDADRFDGTRLIVQELNGCSGGAGVAMVGVFGGGHTVPGGPNPLAFAAGLTSLDASAADLMWDFFAG
jgi:polyhydroxybutyrate depolymerase